jgi:SsrA-binding protein
MAGGVREVATNRAASHRYHLLERLECGVVLTGSEVKSLRAGRAQLKDGYATIKGGELWLHGVHIPPYPQANRENHDPTRPRKLLAKRRELDRLIGLLQERGVTLVPTRIYFKGPRAKVEVAVARGKSAYDKREAIKERESRREIERALSRRLRTGR